jgi:hypothetical protein
MKDTNKPGTTDTNSDHTAKWISGQKPQSSHGLAVSK